jgi:hypothetical protein
MPYTIRVEYAHQRKIRERNKRIYRIAHWPIWVWVFFLAPGPLTFELFAHGPNKRNAIWLLFVLFGTGVAGLCGQLPGVEPRPYILRFCEDKPNPLYRRICYTFAWNALLNFGILNLAGLLDAVSTRVWHLKQIYTYGYFPALAVILAMGVWGMLPRVGRSTKDEGIERRYFYGAVWTMTFSQTLLLVLWKTLARDHSSDIFMLIIFIAAIVLVSTAATLGLLPRTRPILPGEVMIAD